MAIQVKDSDIGRRVFYTEQPTRKREYGIITSYNDSNVFVRYDGDVNSKATSYFDLEYD